MAQQLELVTRVVERFKSTRRVGFSGPEYQVAKDGVVVMDTLAEVTDQDSAEQGLLWAMAQVGKLAQGARA